MGKIIGNVIRRKRGKQRGPKWGKTKKLPPTLCGICNINLNYVNSVQCQECKKYVHLKKCSGLDSEKQYKPDYKCPRCIEVEVEAEAVAYGADDEEDELKNGPDKQPESEKTTGRKRKTVEKEEFPKKKKKKKKKKS